MADEKKLPSVAELKQQVQEQVEAEMVEREKACNLELDPIFKKFNCTSIAEVTIRGNKMQSRVLTAALPAEPGE